MDIVKIFPHFWKGEKIRRASWAKGAYIYKDEYYIHHVFVVNGINGDYVSEQENLISEPTFTTDDIMGADWEITH